MKTKNILAVLISAVALTGITASYASNRGKGNDISPAGAIRYQVTVHLPNIPSLCNIYIVTLTDGSRCKSSVSVPAKPP